jgi:Chromate transporter
MKKPLLTDLFLSFLKLGATAFGGPAMVPYIGRMAVEQEKWLDDSTFRDGVALSQTIPGATAMQTSAYVGFRARGVAGAAASSYYRDRGGHVWIRGVASVEFLEIRREKKHQENFLITANELSQYSRS